MAGPRHGWDVRVLASVLLLAGLATVPIGSPAQAASSETPIIVGFYEMPGERDTYQGEPVVDQSEDLGFLVVETEEPDRFREDARQDEAVRYLEEDRRAAELAYTPNDTRYSDQYAPQITRTGSAWDLTLGSTSVKLGLLDTGITPDHEDFVNDRVSGYDYDNGDDTPEDTAACGYHGSAVTGAAAATTDNGAGIAGMSESSIIMQKIFDEADGDCYGASNSEIAQALEDLADKGAHVSSNSWGLVYGGSLTVNEAIDYAHSKGVIHVAAAGNHGPCTDCVSYPWRDRPNKVVIVSCTDSNDDFCWYSSEGPEIDVAAPGNNVLSVDGGTTSGYAEGDGTSMSAPHVSGAVALRIAHEGDGSFPTIESEVVDSADDVGLSADRQGGGRLDAGQLVTGTPTASFATSCDDLACTFDASDSVDPDGNITSYDWDLGDGTNATGEIVNHTYDSGGDYNVTLNVTGGEDATDEETQTVSVSPNQAPTASFTTSCDDLACSFDAADSVDTDGTITSYDWALGDGTNATGEVVNHTYDSGGDYNVTLNVTDDDGATDQANQTVSVSPNQAPNAIVTASCEDLSCTFDASDSWDEDGSIETYDWGLGDGTAATGAIVEHTYDEPGDYSVAVIVTDDDGASDAAGLTVSVGGPSTMHVHGIEYRSQGLDAEAVVEVYAEDGTPVNGALATVEMCNAKGVCIDRRIKTDRDGRGAATWENGVGGAYTSCVTRLVHGDLSYAPENDHAEDGNCASHVVLPFGLYP